MTIDERLRLSIHSKLTELLGNDEADALITHIMLVPWQDVATKDDLRVLSAELRAEMTDLRSEIADLRTELRTELAGVRAELRTEVVGLRIELHEAITSQTRWLIGYVSGLGAAMLAVARVLF